MNVETVQAILAVILIMFMTIVVQRAVKDMYRSYKEKHEPEEVEEEQAVSEQLKHILDRISRTEEHLYKNRLAEKEYRAAKEKDKKEKEIGNGFRVEVEVTTDHNVFAGYKYIKASKLIKADRFTVEDGRLTFTDKGEITASYPAEDVKEITRIGGRS